MLGIKYPDMYLSIGQVLNLSQSCLGKYLGTPQVLPNTCYGPSRRPVTSDLRAFYGCFTDALCALRTGHVTALVVDQLGAGRLRTLTDAYRCFTDALYTLRVETSSTCDP